MSFRSPVAEYRFLLDHVAGYGALAATGRFAEAGDETLAAILDGAGRLCDAVIAPTNRAGDRDPATLENGVVRSPPGFADAYREIAAGGWIGLSASPDRGGLGLPHTLATVVNEMMAGANLALQLNPLLSQGQIEALEHHAEPWLRDLVVPKLVSGEWSGTMNLTEPQAGSDVGALATRAEPAGDGSYRITGQKIFITWGDCDFTENVTHLVLARLPDAAKGTRGISLFLVPKILPETGARNALRVVSLEHKMGLHGSPTAVMSYDGATGWLVGPPQGGMAAMFTMMNNARIGVAAQGTGVAEAAYQQALDYARTRRQLGAAIIDHADVRRMLATMKAEILAARAIILSCAVAIDMGNATGDAGWIARAGLLTPIAKAFGTDIGHEVAQMGVQVHGGMGFIEETGAAQFARDVRVTQIYEGTNGIQAMDLAGRKLSDGGEAAQRLIDEICQTAEEARPALPDLAEPVWQAAETLREATETLVPRDIAARGAGAAPYLRAFARVLGGQAHLKAALADPARQPLAAFYIRRLLPEHAALLAQVRDGAATVAGLTDADFGV